MWYNKEEGYLCLELNVSKSSRIARTLAHQCCDLNGAILDHQYEVLKWIYRFEEIFKLLLGVRVWKILHKDGSPLDGFIILHHRCLHLHLALGGTLTHQKSTI